MPVISNATVATGTGLSTAGNGGRKLVRLANGNMYSVIKNGNNFVIYKSVNGGSTWSQHYTNGGNTSLQDVALATKGNDLYLLWSFNNTTVGLLAFLSESSSPVGATLDSSQSALGNISLAINDAGTELHAAWSSKNATYPNSFNIRYAKGTINSDGSVTWGAVEQVTKDDGNNVVSVKPSIVIDKSGVATIFIEQQNGGFSGAGYSSGAIGIVVLKKDLSLNVGNSRLDSQWSWKGVLQNATYAQSSPSAIFVPQTINGLANGRLWVAWHGKDATDSAKFNARVSYSDDGGVTWATPVKLTSGNTFDCQNVTLGADKTGKVFALYESHQWSPDIGIRMKTFNGSWGAEVGVATANTAEQYPSSLVDYTLQMTTPPTVYTDTTEGIKFVGNFNVGASVSPVSGALGNKETATLAAYTVTPEAGSTVTQIVERVNGTIVNTFNNPASLSRTLTVPTATWDTLAYFANHTASVTVTDSNGATTVTTYSFDKRLATGASLLEATKANTDAKNRISTKRDMLASQVGLSAGATFDAILGAFGSSVVKKQEGTFTTNGSGVATVTGLAFEPDLVFFMAVNGRSGHISKKYKAYQGIADGSNYGVVVIGSSAQTTSSSIVSNGFNVAGATGNLTYTFTAYG